MDTQTSVQPIILEEYVRRYESEGPFEIIDGIRREIMPLLPGLAISLQDLFNVE